MFYFNYWIKKYTINTDFFLMLKISIVWELIAYTIEKFGERILVKLFQGSGISMEEEDAERS